MIRKYFEGDIHLCKNKEFLIKLFGVILIDIFK